jgi:hypothetical protein
MHVYKFRILSEEQNDFVRDIEIGNKQTFEDFHNILLKSSGLDGKELASFHITNGKWIKLKEITLLDMMEEQPDFDEDEDDEPKVKLPKTLVMKDCKLKDYIDDPHQRLIYEYDFLNLQTFFIELIQISEAKKGITYPVCTRSVGKLETKKKNAAKKGVPEDLGDLDVENLSIESLLDDEDTDSMGTNTNFEFGDGFEEIKPI